MRPSPRIFSKSTVYADMFDLHPRLAGDCALVTDLALAKVLLMKDQRYPWLILVPGRPGLKEIHELDREAQGLLMADITKASRVLDALYRPDKINIGALGNLVAQLHIHVVAREIGDPAWPGPVWGVGEALPYDEDALEVRLGELRHAFGDNQ